jgi:hypothetical protein
VKDHNSNPIATSKLELNQFADQFISKSTSEEIL